MATSDSSIWIRCLERLARLQPWYLLTRYQNRVTRSVFAFVNGCIAIGIMTGAAVYTNQPLIFPSLGPSAFLFFYQPSSPASSPRNTILAHGSGLIIGWLAFILFGNETPIRQIVAAALSLGLVSAVMVAADIPHPPAASTTLIVSLGNMSDLDQIAALLVAVVLLTAQGFFINRLCGIDYPVWRAPDVQPRGDISVSALRTAAGAQPRDLYADLADRLASRQSVLPTEKPSPYRDPGE